MVKTLVYLWIERLLGSGPALGSSHFPLLPAALPPPLPLSSQYGELSVNSFG